MRNVIVTAIAMVLMVTLTGCFEQKWHLSLVSAADPERPEFCISESPDCEGADASLSRLVIREVNNLGEESRKMWTIEPMNGAGIRQFIYGSLPEGWDVIDPPKKLQSGVFYSVNGTYFFRLTNKDYTDCEIFTEKEYNEIMLSLRNM
jgi:hypothetical protein